MENRSSSQTALRMRQIDPGELIYVPNPIEFEAPVRFLELIETPLETIPAAEATPSVLNNTKIVLSSIAPVNITNFVDGQEGQTIFVVGDGNSTLVHGTSIFTNSENDKLLNNGSVYIFTRVNGEWRETAATNTISYLTASLSADVQLTTTGTFYDGPSISLPSGTWLVTGQITITRTATTLATYTGRIVSNSTTVASSQQSVVSVNPHSANIHLHCVLVLASTTTVKLTATSSAGTTTTHMKAATNTYSGGNNATTISAIRLG